MDQGSRARPNQKPSRIGRGLYLTFVCCALAYCFYSWVTFSGPYRWLAEIQVAQFGAYDVKLTFIVLVLLAFIPAVLVLVPVYAVRKLRGLPTVDITAPSAPTRPWSPDTERRVYLGIGALGLVLFLIGGAISYNKSQRVITYAPFDLNSGAAPASAYVDLAGIAIPRLQVQFQETSNGNTKTTAYIPLVAKGWKKGDPITYFLRPNYTYYTSEEGSHPVDSDSPAFRIRQTGVLFRDDLPGLVSARYERDGVKLGAPPIVLDTDARSDLLPYLGVTFAGGIMMVMTPMLLVALRIKNARARKRVSA